MATYENTILNQTPEVYYRLGESSGTTASDSSGNGYDGTYTNSPTLGATGLVPTSGNGAVEFSTTSYVELSSSPVTVSSGTPFSVSFIIRRNTSNDSHIVNIPDGGTGFVIAQNGPNRVQYGDFHFGSNTGWPEAKVELDEAVKNNKVYHCVLVYDGGTSTSLSSFKFYVNNVEQTLANSSTISAETTTSLLVGKRASTSGNGFDGIIDEVAIFNSALTAANVSSQYDAIYPSGIKGEILELAPILYYRLEEASGVVAIDSSINTYDGTYVNSPTLAQSGLVTGSTYSVDFQSVDDDRIDAPNIGLSASDTFTVEAWFQCASGTEHDGRIFIAIEDKFDRNLVDLSVTASGFVRFRYLYTNGTDEASVTNSVNVFDDTTHHVVGILDGSTNKVTLYLDGFKVGEDTGPSSFESGTLDKVYVGSSVDPRDGSLDLSFDGLIDEVAVYGYDINATDITSHSNTASGTLTKPFTSVKKFRLDFSRCYPTSTNNYVGLDRSGTAFYDEDGTNLTYLAGNTALASSSRSGFSASNLFISGNGDGWVTDGDHHGWWQCEFSSAQTLERLTLLKEGTYPAWEPEEIRIVVEDNSGNRYWAVLKNEEGLSEITTSPDDYYLSDLSWSAVNKPTDIVKIKFDYSHAYDITQAVGLDREGFYIRDRDNVELKTLAGTTITASSEFNTSYEADNLLLTTSGNGWGATWGQAGWVEIEFTSPQDITFVRFPAEPSFNQWKVEYTKFILEDSSGVVYENDYGWSSGDLLSYHDGSADLESADWSSSSTVDTDILNYSPFIYWKLDDADSSAVVDYSGNSFDGAWTAVGASEAQAADIIGDGNPVLEVQDGNGRVIHDDAASGGTTPTPDGSFSWFNNNAWTYICFIKPTATTATVSLMRIGGTFGQGELVYIDYNGDGDVIASSTESELELTVSNAIAFGELNMVVYKEDAGLQGTSPTPKRYLSVISDNKITRAELNKFRSSTAVSSIEVGVIGVITGLSNQAFGHTAFFPSKLTDSEVEGIYTDLTGTTPGTSTGTITSAQSSQTSFGVGSVVGSDNVTGTGEAVQGSQTELMTATFVPPNNYLASTQRGQTAVISATNDSEPTTLRYASGGLTTNPSSTPANTFIQPRLKNAGNYKVEIVPGETGIVTPSFGQVTLDNTDGELDYLANKAFDGGSYKLWYGPKNGTFPDDFTKVVDTTMGDATFTKDAVKIKLKDKTEAYNTPVMNTRFSGTGGVEGDSTVVNKPKQRAFNRLWGVPVQAINSQKLIYHVCEEPLLDRVETALTTDSDPLGDRPTPRDPNDSSSQGNSPRIFDGGTQIQNESDYSTLADLIYVPPSTGKARWYRPVSGPTLVRLGTEPDKDLRVDIVTSNRTDVYGTDESGTWQLQDVLSNILNAPSFTSTSENPKASILVDDASFTYTDLINSFCKKGFYSAWVTKDGEFNVSKIELPDQSSTPVFTFTQSNINDITLDPVIPVWKYIINTGETWPSDVNTGISEARRVEFTEEPYHDTTVDETPSIRSRNGLAQVRQVDSRDWWYEDEVDTYLTESKNLLSKPRYIVTVSLDRGQMNTTTLAIDLMDDVEVKMNRWWFKDGFIMKVIGIRQDYNTGKLVFTLFA